MKKTVITITLTSLITVVLAFGMFSFSGFSIGSLMIHEKVSPYGFEKTVTTIQENAKEKGWVVPKQYNFQKSLLKYNQPDCGKVAVLKLCHPEIAGEMLGKDDHKFVSVMMPCSVSVYEKDDGKTYVASMNMNLMSKVMGKDVGPILSRVANEDETILAFLN